MGSDMDTPRARPVVSSFRALLAAACATLVMLDARAGIQVVYGPLADSNLKAMLIRAKVGERIRQHLLSFAPNASLRLRIADCGAINAFYRGGVTHEIHLCGEMVAHLIGQRTFANGGSRVAGGAALWVASHELGHYLINAHRLPVLGREEDVADQVGLAVLLRSSISREGMIGAMRFLSHEPTQQDPGGVHSLDATRRVNLACWAYGTDPSRYGTLLHHIPSGRRIGCRDEASKMWRGLQEMRRVTGR